MVTVSWSVKEEAEKCRRQAAAFAGKPEEKCLLKIAREFELLVVQNEAAKADMARQFETSH